jgi:glycogen debranching enzyme
VRLASGREEAVDDIIQYQEQFYILATSSLLQERRHVLKDGDSFAVFDMQGDVAPFGAGEQGYFHAGTRHLSRLRQTINGQRPLLLSSRVREENDLFGADLTNPDQVREGVVFFPRDVLHIYRSRFLWDGHWYERLRIANYGLATISATLTLEFGADYADIFEVRGLKREHRGTMLPPLVDVASVRLAYEGLDGAVRATMLLFDPAPTAVEADRVCYHVELARDQARILNLTIRCEGPESHGPTRAYDEACGAAAVRGSTRRRRWCHLFTENEQFNEWCNRSAADIRMMTSEMPTGAYVYAGVPWFSTPFGRDGIITALQVLWLDPDLARGTLAYLAVTQALAISPEQDAEPGKILHETRAGEMARLREVPFGQYYGSVDATPLFVILAGHYYARTGDREFIAGLWDHIDRALRWIDEHGDVDGDGFVEYARRNPTGLVHQGWKDSSDAVSHSDGTLAEGPIALCEVQGYVFEAKRQGARLAGLLGLEERARVLAGDARALRARFDRAFWSEELGTYALALEGRKRRCDVRASNAGHCLFTGIVPPARARRVAETLMSDAFFTGWGVRTLAATEVRYNPMSYHNGSVWPHDNALIGAGFARYGMRPAAARILAGLFDASLFVDRYRMPELFCGFRRRSGEGPTLYPVACSPQAWSAGAVFMLLQAMLGLSVDGPARRVTIRSGLLPEFLPRVRIEGLRIGNGSVDLVLERHAKDIGVQVERNDAKAEVVVIT